MFGNLIGRIWQLKTRTWWGRSELAIVCGNPKQPISTLWTAAPLTSTAPSGVRAAWWIFSENLRFRGESGGGNGSLHSARKLLNFRSPELWERNPLSDRRKKMINQRSVTVKGTVQVVIQVLKYIHRSENSPLLIASWTSIRGKLLQWSSVLYYHAYVILKL